MPAPHRLVFFRPTNSVKTLKAWNQQLKSGGKLKSKNKTVMLRSVGKQSWESVKSVPKKERKVGEGFAGKELLLACR